MRTLAYRRHAAAALSAIALGACRTWTPASRAAYYVGADVLLRFTAPRVACVALAFAAAALVVIELACGNAGAL